MSSQTYDIVIMVGIVILVGIIIFWTVRYGSAVVSDLMMDAPVVLQSSFASYASAACAGDILVEHDITTRYPFYAFLNASHVKVTPTESKSRPFGSGERGGYVVFATMPAMPFVNCGLDVIKRNVQFNENVNRFVTLNRTENAMQIGVR